MSVTPAPLEKELFTLICDILDGLQEALPQFAARAGEQVFKTHPDVSTRLEKNQVKRMQREIEQCARTETGRIIRELSDESLWLLPASRKKRESLHHNPRVWKVIQTFTPPLNQLFMDYGYPEIHGPSGVFFTATRLETLQDLPGADALQLLTIKYWVLLARQRQQSQIQQQQQQHSTSRQLDALWND